MTKQEILNNPALDEHALSFCPFGVMPEFIQINGQNRLHYVPDKKGIRRTDEHTAELCLYSPGSKSVVFCYDGDGMERHAMFTAGNGCGS